MQQLQIIFQLKTHTTTLLFQQKLRDRLILGSLVFACLFLSFGSKLNAQTELDSMYKLLENTTQRGTTQVLILDELGWMLKAENPDQARKYLREAIAISEELDYKRGLSKAWNDLGVVETMHNNIEAAIIANNKALEVREELGDKKGIASVYNNLAGIYDEQGDYTNALKSYKRSQQMRRELNDTARIARLDYNISLIQDKLGNYVEAQDHILKYMIYAEEEGDEEDLAYGYNSRGNILYGLNDLSGAMGFYLKADSLFKKLEYDWERASALNNRASILGDMADERKDSNRLEEAKILFDSASVILRKVIEIRKEIEDESGLGEAYNNLGGIYKDLGSYYEEIEEQSEAKQRWNIALNYFRKASEVYEKIDVKKGLVEVLNGYGDVYRRQKDFASARESTEEMLELAKEIGDKRGERNAYKDLSKIFEENGKYKEAFEYQKKYTKLRHEIIDDDQSKRLARREALYGDEQKEREIERQAARNKLLDAKIERDAIVRNSLMGGAGALLLLAMLLYNRYRIKTKANRALEEKNEIIEKERERSDELLLNILPEETANELKEHGSAKARKYDSVTVLFSDFKGFTQIAEKLTPEELVAELDACFRGFDAIMDKYNVEKIKTIGDAYMAVGGLPEPNKTHPTDVINAALEMQQFMINRKKTQDTFDMRIGIHTGSVVAGVVGNRKFAYDIWGDAVNLAARMESSGEPGKVNISEVTSKLLNGQFSLTARGKIAAKNKGQVEMFFVNKDSSNISKA